MNTPQPEHAGTAGHPSTSPPPPSGAPYGTSPPPRTAHPPRRPWRERLPEVVAGVGAGLVVLALAGFLFSTWDGLGEYAKALTLAAAAAGLTVAGLWADQSGRRTFAALVPMLWATGTAVLTGAVHIAGIEAMPDASRVAIALAGMAGLAHAVALWRRRPEGILLQLAAAGAAVYGAGPIGSSLADRYNPTQLPELLRPLVGVFTPTVETDAFAIVAIGHLVVAVAWMALGRVLPGRAAHVARVGGSALVGYAAMEFHVLASPIGATAALLIVLGYLIAGIALDDVFLIVVGSAGALVTGVKVIWALFSGEIAVTLTIFAVGLAMLAWAYRAAQQRGTPSTADPA